MARYTVNPAAMERARELIEARQYVLKSDWGEAQPKADDQIAFLERHSWDEYSAWHLGLTVGATDETGAEAVECVHHVRDLHVTILRLLGLHDTKLTYFHGGRYKQLSQFGGQVIKELLA